MSNENISYRKHDGFWRGYIVLDGQQFFFKEKSKDEIEEKINLLKECHSMTGNFFKPTDAVNAIIYGRYEKEFIIGLEINTLETIWPVKPITATANYYSGGFSNYAKIHNLKANKDYYRFDENDVEFLKTNRRIADYLELTPSIHALYCFKQSGLLYYLENIATINENGKNFGNWIMDKLTNNKSKVTLITKDCITTQSSGCFQFNLSDEAPIKTKMDLAKAILKVTDISDDKKLELLSKLI